MAEQYIPYTSTQRPTSGLRNLSTPRWTAPASSTRVAQPSAYERIFGLPKPQIEKPSFSQLLQSIKDMDSLVVLPEWHNYMSNERALELTRVLRDYGGYNGLDWNLTSGFANPRLDSLIRYRFPDYPRRFSQADSTSFKGVHIPGTNIGLDVPHFNATLSRYLDNDALRSRIPSDWAGWAGDMFSFADSLDYMWRKGIEIDSLHRFAKSNLGFSTNWKGNPFGQEDLYADIDARNISTLIRTGLSYHDAMDKYYNQNCYGRFIHFVNSYGGWKNFVKHVNSFYFFPLTPTVNPIFVQTTKQTFIRKILEGMLNEMDCYIP